jgi:hypothetical protein
MDCQVGEIEGVGWLLRRHLTAPVDQQLAESPAHKTRIGVNAGKALLRSKLEKLLQKSGSLGTGPGEDGVDEAKDGGEGVGLAKLEQPASDLAAVGTDGEQVEELRVLLRRPV